MKSLKTLALAAALLAFAGCGTARESAPADANSTASSAQSAGTVAGNNAPAQQTGPQIQKVSLNQAGASQEAPTAIARKIIRNASLTLEIDTPSEGQRRITSIVESRGGFVVTSESRQNTNQDDESKTYEVVTVEARVPAPQFEAALGELRSIGRVREEKITGQDVTEEFIDLEARIRTQRALEEQFLQIMKQATRVSDALEVQSELANVRTEIERLEGRRRFLENQASLSTIKLTLQPPASFVNASTAGFWRGLKSAIGDGIDFASNLMLVLIRVGIALIPLALFVVLPIWLLFRYLLRRRRSRFDRTPETVK